MTKIHREAGKRWNLPDRLNFAESGFRPALRDYRVLGFRPPRAGEYYLSGAIVAAYRAPSDLSDAYLVVQPIKES